MLTMADDGEAELFSKLEKIKEIRYFFDSLATYKICLVTLAGLFMQKSKAVWRLGYVSVNIQ